MPRKTRRRDDEAPPNTQMARRIEALRRRVGTAKAEGLSAVKLGDALDYELMQRALEAFKHIMNTGPLLAPQE